MMVEAGIVGVVKTVLILIGVFVILRIVGRLMVARRNHAEEKKMKSYESERKKAHKQHIKDKGKISISKSPNNHHDDDYADFEVMDD